MKNSKEICILRVVKAQRIILFNIEILNKSNSFSAIEIVNDFFLLN